MKKESDLKRLIEYAGERSFLIYLSWILSAVSALIALVPFWYIWKILEEVIRIAPEFDKAENLISNGWMAVISAIISVIIYISALMCSHLAAFRVATNMRKQTMRYIVRLPLGFTEEFGSGKLRKIVNESSAATETYLAHQLPDRAGAIATPLGMLVLLFAFDWRLGLMSLIPVVLGFLIMFAMTGPSMEKKMAEYQNALEDMSNEAVEYVRGIPVVKTFGQTVFSFKKFKESIDRYGTWVISYTKELRMPMIAYTAAINAVFVFLTAAAVLFTANGVTAEFLLDLTFYIIITPVISLTLTRIMMQSENQMIVRDALSRVDSIFEKQPLLEVKPFKNPSNFDIELKDVSFSYDGENDVIKNISMEIKEGSTIALVGPSGSGKTTLGNLISRYYDPGSGSIRIGGVDLRNISKEDLMNIVSFVFQDSKLLKGSIFENVRMGKPDASRAEVMEALELAQCKDIIDKMPNGIDTLIGTEGTYLSGGEQQRLAIARVILKDTPIVILDEATAFADPDNETRVQAAFNNLSEKKTVIMIAHRLSTVVNADKIYVLKNGSITEAGNSDELMSMGGLFSSMMKDYRKAAEWKVSGNSSLKIGLEKEVGV